MQDVKDMTVEELEAEVLALRQALRDLLATRRGIDYTTAEEQDVLRRARRLAR